MYARTLSMMKNGFLFMMLAGLILLVSVLAGLFLGALLAFIRDFYQPLLVISNFAIAAGLFRIACRIKIAKS